jgi:hypothetical protein
MAESHFREQPPERRRNAPRTGLFADLQSSTDDVIDIEHARRILTESLDTLVSKLNVPKISALSRELIAIGNELRQIETILRSSPERSGAYRSTIKNRLRAGKRALDAILKQFEAAQVLGFIEWVADAQLVTRAKLTLSNLPEADRLILDRLQLSEAERRILASVFDQLARGEVAQISRLFDPSRFDSYSGFENLPEPPIDDLQRRKRLIVLTAGGFKIFPALA